MKHVGRLMGLALSLALLAAACGDDDGAVGGPGETITVSAIDFEFVGLPERVLAGTTLALQNDAPTELHELVAVRLPEGEERSVEELMQLPPNELEALFSGLATVIIAPPGQMGFPVVGDGSLTEPGRYAVLCFIPTGADPDEYLAAAAESDGPPDVPGGPPHVVHGMYGELTVEG